VIQKVNNRKWAKWRQYGLKTVQRIHLQHEYHDEMMTEKGRREEKSIRERK